MKKALLVVLYFSTPSLESEIADKMEQLRDRGSTMQPIGGEE